MRRVLFIGYVWPEPRSSAAGSRVMGLIRCMREAGWAVEFASASKENEHQAALESAGIPTHPVELNHSGFDQLIASLVPDYVFFDRFVTEEQFGWRVAKNAPDAVRVLDTEDLHFLRRAREQAFRSGKTLELMTDDALRELSSIARSDLTLLISSYERRLLLDLREIPVREASLLQIPLLYETPKVPTRGFSERDGIAMIGNFRHPPNLDGTIWFAKSIWPLIRKQIPQATIHLYGAYPPREVMALDDPSRGIHSHGWAPDAFEALSKHRVSVAPLRFGAGQKGKIADSWWTGTPAVTTSIGMEGMLDEADEGDARDRFVADDPEEFCQKVAKLYLNESDWNEAGRICLNYIRKGFEFSSHSRTLIDQLESTRLQLASLRSENLLGRLLRFNLNRGTEYFGRWLELKAKTETGRQAP